MSLSDEEAHQHENVKQVLVNWHWRCPSSDDLSVASHFMNLVSDLWQQQKKFSLCDGDL